MSDIDFTVFPIISTSDFAYAEIDALELPNGDGYFAMISFFKENEDEESTVAHGFTLDTTIYGDTLGEVFEKAEMLFASGLFDDINVSAHGTLWSIEGEEKGPICWMHEGGVLDDPHDCETTVPPEEKKPTLH